MVKIEKINFSYNKTFAIKDFSAFIEKQDFVGVIGPNGSGKSTLLKLIARILTPSSGSILFENRDIRKLPFELYSRLTGYLPSNMETYFHYTTEEFISMGRFPYTGRYGKLGHEDLRIIKEAIEIFDLERFRKRSTMELSEGEKQRVFLAQSLVQKPRILVLDEPTSHLDIGHQYRIMDILKKLNKEGLTVISVMHDLNLASEYCDSLILLKDGKTHSSGAPEEVITYKNIEDAYDTKVLVYKNPFSQKPYVFGIPSHTVPPKNI